MCLTVSCLKWLKAFLSLVRQDPDPFDTGSMRRLTDRLSFSWVSCAETKWGFFECGRSVPQKPAADVGLTKETSKLFIIYSVFASQTNKQSGFSGGNPLLIQFICISVFPKNICLTNGELPTPLCPLAMAGLMCFPKAFKLFTFGKQALNFLALKSLGFGMRWSGQWHRCMW